MTSINRPHETEYAPYYGRYVSLVPEGDLLAILYEQLRETLDLFRSVPESQASYRYAPGKWSIKEVLGHLIDGERVFTYRALRFARADSTPLPGFEQDDFVRHGAFDDQPFEELISEFEHVRRATILMFKHLSDEAWDRRGTANDSEVSVRALAYIIAGHELHHRQVLRSRYLQNSAGEA